MKFTDWFTQHKDADVRTRVRAATRLSMTDEERERGRAYLERHIAMHPARAARNPSRLMFLLHPMPVLASLLIIVVSGVSVAGAAESALPGDALYAVKVNVNEEVKLALASTPEKKADATLERAERRLQELATLSERGDVDETLREEIDERLDAHVHDAEVRSTEIDDDRARDIERRVVSLLRAHEALVAPGEIGGYAEPEIDIARVAAQETGDAAGASLMVATEEPAPASMMMMAIEAPASQMRGAAPADAPLAEAAPETSPQVTETVSTKRADTSLVSEKALKRLERTARERIEALEKLLAREEKQNAKRVEKRENPRDTSILISGIANAQDSFTNATSARESGNTLDASALFNSAIRFAIDARETYQDSVREVKDDARNEDESDDRSGRRDGERIDSRHDD
jgi:hypothetical protein